ncbi:MAG: IS66 family insertion sequence element accessory protein TnpB [Rhodanobacteraceae bacterium]|nr:IS66 family insertion sequence element accessory protein TnpB [Rhodanobacteraceae bacterium]
MVGGLPVWVCADAVGFRLGIDGLALRVQASLGPQRALSSAHVFFNRGRDKVKILWYDRHGWWLMYKRLERGRFSSVTAGALSESDLRLVLEGIDLSVRRLRPVTAMRVA